MPKKSGEKTKTKPPRRPNSQKSGAGPASQRYVVDESVIEGYIKRLRVRDTEEAMARLQAVSDLTAGMLVAPYEIDRKAVETIKRLAGESRDRGYREMMREMVAAIERGREGMEAAHRTATRTVEMGFRWSIYYFAALEMYRNRLRRICRNAEGGAHQSAKK